MHGSFAHRFGLPWGLETDYSEVRALGNDLHCSSSHSVPRFCQGSTPHGLKFEAFYGEEWEQRVENKFREWAVRAFGGALMLLHSTHPSNLSYNREGK